MIYILLPVHNRKTVTELFVKALLKQTYQNFKLILIDDGSIDGTSDMVLGYFPDAVIIKGNGNLWWAGGLQKGYEWLLKNSNDNDICVMINDDVTFEDNFLEIGYEIISKLEKTLLQAVCYGLKSGVLEDFGVYFDYKRLTFELVKDYQITNCLSTRGLFLKIKDFKIIGGFYPKILPHYLSDYEFTIRAYNKKYQLITDNKLFLYVDEDTTGYHKIVSKTIKEYYGKYFSYRNVSNPIHWFFFICLVVPFPYKIYHIVKLFYRFIKDVTRPIIKK